MSKETSILPIPIKRESFDAILAGTKKEEYRAFSPFWISRLATMNEQGEIDSLRQYDIVRFRHGSSSNSRMMDVEFKEIVIEEYTDEPEDSEERYGFAILLGEVLQTENV